MRFWAKVDKAGPVPQHCPELGPCWLWRGAKGTAAGYGRFRLGRASEGMTQAHRWSLQEYLGRDLGPGLWALHHCDNPACVNPAHLYEGTVLDNERDKDARGRRKLPYTPPEKIRRGEASNKAKLTEEQVRYIKSLAWETECSRADLSRRFGVTKSIITRILAGRIWRHVSAAA